MNKPKLIIVNNIPGVNSLLVDSVKEGITLEEKYNQLEDASSLDFYLNLISHISGIHVDAIKGKQRHKPILMARKIYMTAAYKFSTFSIEKIAWKVNKDHASVIHSVNTLVEDYNCNVLEYWYTKKWVEKMCLALDRDVKTMLSGANRNAVYIKEGS